MRPIEKGVSGSGMHLHRLLADFVRLRHGCDLTFLRNSNRELDLYKHGEAITISRNPVRASWELRHRRFDIIHYSPLSVLSPIGVKARRRCATLHPDDELIIPQCYSWKRRIHSRHFVGLYARRMDRIFTVSQTSRDLIAQCYRVSPDRISLTPNAVDEKFRVLSESETGDARERFAEGSRFVLHVSNFSERKNPWTLIAAFGLVAAKVSDLRFVVVGNGWADNPRVDSAIRKAGLSGRIVFPGFVDELDVPRLMNLAEVFVFPSLSEGFGMPNLEAMACGCPVITSDAFAIPEVVGDAALVLQSKSNPAELCEKVLRVIHDSELRAGLREKGLLRVWDFSWEDSARELLAGYENLLAND